MVEKRSNKLLYDLAHKIKLANIQEKLLNAKTTLSEAMQDTFLEYEEIINAILFAKRGVIHPAVISPYDLYLELQQARLPTDKTFPFKISEETMFKFTNLCRVNSSITESSYLVFKFLSSN